MHSIGSPSPNPFNLDPESKSKCFCKNGAFLVSVTTKIHFFSIKCMLCFRRQLVGLTRELTLLMACGSVPLDASRAAAGAAAARRPAAARDEREAGVPAGDAGLRRGRAARGPRAAGPARGAHQPKPREAAARGCLPLGRRAWAVRGAARVAGGVECEAERVARGRGEASPAQAAFPSLDSTIFIPTGDS